MNKAPKIIINLLIAPIIGCLLLVGAFSIPTDNINKHVKESAQILIDEAKKKDVFSWCTSSLDIYSDSLMLLEAAYDGKESVVDKIMESYRYDFGDESIDDMDTLERQYINNETPDSKLSYARYWHGYLISLKPMLYLFNYQTIRIINLIVEIAILIFVCVLMWKKKMRKYIFPYLVLYLMLNPYVLAFNFENATCYYVYSIGTLLLLLFKDKVDKYAYLIFLNIGIITSYLDLLTWPVATIGIPLLFYITTTKENHKNGLIDVLKLCICWSLGYVFMWASKWVLAQIITGDNVINDAINQILVRSSNNSGQGTSYSLFACIMNNYYLYLRTPATFIMIAYIVYMLIKYFKLFNRNVFNTKDLLVFLFVSILPILWFSVTLNHSYAHCTKFVNRDTVVTWMAVLFYLTKETQLTK